MSYWIEAAVGATVGASWVYNGHWIAAKLRRTKVGASRSTEPIVGYRVWRCEDGRLLSATHIHVWPCRKPLVKDKIENLGIHAIKNGENVPQLFASYNARVAGEVYLWGEVKEHTEGYLAEFAYPKELWMPEDTDPLLIMELEENYGVPVILRADLVKHEPMPIQQFSASACQGTYVYTAAANQAMYYPQISAASGYAQMQQNALAAQQAQYQTMVNAQHDMLRYAIQPIMLKPGNIVDLP